MDSWNEGTGRIPAGIADSIKSATFEELVDLYITFATGQNLKDDHPIVRAVINQGCQVQEPEISCEWETLRIKGIPWSFRGVTIKADDKKHWFIHFDAAPNDPLLDRESWADHAFPVRFLENGELSEIPCQSLRETFSRGFATMDMILTHFSLQLKLERKAELGMSTKEAWWKAVRDKRSDIDKDWMSDLTVEEHYDV